MRIVEMRAAIVAKLVAAFPELTNDAIAAFPRAQMDTSDLNEALRNRNLALRVAFTGIVDDAQLSSNEIDAPETWCIFVAAKDVANGPKRDVVLLTILPDILHAVAPGQWLDGATEDDPDDNAHEVEKLRAQPLYEGEVDTKGALLWAVTWQQTVSIPATLAVDDLRDFLTLITSYDLAPADEDIDATDTIQMRQP